MQISLTNSTSYITVQPVTLLSILRAHALYHGYPKVKVFLWVAYGVSKARTLNYRRANEEADLDDRFYDVPYIPLCGDFL